MASVSKKNFFYFLKGTDIEADLHVLDDASQQTLKTVVHQNLSPDDLRVFLEQNLELDET